ncbi:transcription antitermination factor NusB [Dysgonomonas sp. 511]|uniref:transcription antitermination factor NusB n=1 Tax=Dysgonomonas sp. 511 TaxID=2302930 RepID=UPI0013D29DC6|nr:transcription antitermination factor NusB [Dysgonomonas sp. 511]NDV78513.1 transcription antitermination factor NusB [Dysgonomonas sp. 511]
MINRVLIRIRVVQIVFACCHSETTDLRKAESELLLSLQKSYDLYYYLLALMVELTDAYKQRIEARKAKLRPTEEDRSPNMRLIENLFIKQLRDNVYFVKYMADRPFAWSEHDAFLRNLLDNILDSEAYKEYAANNDHSYEIDREFWRKIFKQIISANEELCNTLEDESLYWNDDVEIVESFVLKTIKRFDPKNGIEQELLPMFKDETDREFAFKLLRESLFNGKEYRALIDKYTKNWETERIAMMDMVIMQIATAELLTFPSIPVSVTLNEYIDISKSYSTAKSASFINGILDSMVKDLKEEKRIIKK